MRKDIISKAKWNAEWKKWCAASIAVDVGGWFRTIPESRTWQVTEEKYYCGPVVEPPVSNRRGWESLRPPIPNRMVLLEEGTGGPEKREIIWVERRAVKASTL